MPPTKLPYQQEETFTDFEIINIREIAESFGEKISLQETNLQYGGILTKISAATPQHIEFLLWEFNKLKKIQEELKINLNVKPESGGSKFKCETSMFIENSIFDFPF